MHGNSFVGFGGSDLGNRRRQNINGHYDDDVIGGNDVGSCGDEEFGGEGLGGVGSGGGVRSGVVRGSALVVGLVEGLSNA